MSVLEADPTHIPSVLELWKELMTFHEPFDSLFEMSQGAEKSMASHLEKLIAGKDSLVLIAIEDDGIVGYTIAQIASYPPVFVRQKYGRISDMAVRQLSRRRRHGELMLDKTIAWFHEQGVDRVELRVVSKNLVAYSFWKKHGFTDYIHELYKDI